MKECNEAPIECQGDLSDEMIHAGNRGSVLLMDAQLEAVMHKCRLTELGKAFVRQVRGSPPESSYHANRERGNIFGRVSRDLNQQVLQLGSIYPEFFATYYPDTALMSPNVLEFWCPSGAQHDERFGTDRRVQDDAGHRPHGLVIEDDSVSFIELHPKED